MIVTQYNMLVYFLRVLNVLKDDTQNNTDRHIIYKLNLLLDYMIYLFAITLITRNNNISKN